MDHLQSLVDNILDVWIYHNLIQLISEFLPSKYYEKFKNEIIDKIDSYEIIYKGTSMDITEVGNLGRLNVGDEIYMTIPIEFIYFDWKEYFSLKKRSYPKSICCKCNKIPKKIHIKRYIINRDNDGILICYKCHLCNYNNYISISEYTIFCDEWRVNGYIDYMLGKNIDFGIL